MAWPMMAWVLDNWYAGLQSAGRIAESAIVVRGAGESQLIDLMNACLARFPGIKVFSLPHMSRRRSLYRAWRAREADRIAAAITELKSGVTALGFRCLKPPESSGFFLARVHCLARCASILAWLISANCCGRFRQVIVGRMTAEIADLTAANAISEPAGPISPFCRARSRHSCCIPPLALRSACGCPTGSPRQRHRRS